MVWADPRYLTTVLAFLLHNALRLSAEEPKNAITVRGAAESKGCFTLTVTQAGTLVPQTQAERLFAEPDAFPIARRLPKQGLIEVDADGDACVWPELGRGRPQDPLDRSLVGEICNRLVRHCVCIQGNRSRGIRHRETFENRDLAKHAQRSAAVLDG